MSMTDTEHGLFAEISASINTIKEHLGRRDRRDSLAARAETPVYMRIHGTVIIPASGLAVIQFDNNGPDQGYFWHLRRLGVCGNTPATTAAGTADVFVSAQTITQNGVVPTLDWVDRAGSLPLFGDYSPGECVLQYGENLQLIINSGTVGQAYNAIGLIQQFQWAAFGQDYTI